MILRRTYSAIVLVCLQILFSTSIATGKSLHLPTRQILSKRQSTLWASFLNAVVSHNIDELETINQDLEKQISISRQANDDQISEKKWKTIDCLVHVVTCYRRRRKRFSSPANS